MTMPSVPDEYAELRRKQVLDAAWELFAERGYHETTMRAIAAKLGATTGVVYTYFTGKGEIIAALEARSARESGRMAESLSAEGSVRGALVRLMTALAEHWGRAEGTTGVRANAVLLGEAMKPGNVREGAQRLYRRTVQTFRGLAAQGVEVGELAEETDVEALGSLLAALFLGLQMESALMDDLDPGEQLEGIGNVLLANIWRGPATGRPTGGRR
jgi:AcrR family transcriptional regulator